MTCWDSIIDAMPTDSSESLRNLAYRPALREDEPFLRQMCHAKIYGMVGQNLHGVEVPTVDEAMADPGIGKFVNGWGRDEDYGQIAEWRGAKIGAAWYRLYPALPPDLPPYELSVALKLDYTRLGIGPELIRRTMRHANASGIAAMSLQVHVKNLVALRAYQRLGFIQDPQARADETGYIPMVASTNPFADIY